MCFNVFFMLNHEVTIIKMDLGVSKMLLIHEMSLNPVSLNHETPVPCFNKLMLIMVELYEVSIQELV